MAKKLTYYELSLSVINTHINKGIGTLFTVDEICEEIINKGGILRVNFGVTPKAYLQNLAAMGILEPDYEVKEEAYVVAALGIDAAQEVVKNRKWPVPHYEDPYDH